MYFVRMAVTKIYNLRDFKFVTELFRNREKKNKFKSSFDTRHHSLLLE